MLEYVFFDERPRDQFVNFLQEKTVELKLEEDEGLLKVWISEDLDDDIDEAIEDFYDDMMALNQQLMKMKTTKLKWAITRRVSCWNSIRVKMFTLRLIRSCLAGL